MCSRGDDQSVLINLTEKKMIQKKESVLLMFKLDTLIRRYKQLPHSNLICKQISKQTKLKLKPFKS